MRCPKCKSKAVASATRFIEYSNSQRRIRTCKCGFKFTTYERIESETQDLSKHSKQKKKQYYRKMLLLIGLLITLGVVGVLILIKIYNPH